MTNLEYDKLLQRLEWIIKDGRPDQSETQNALNAIRELRTENKILHRAYNELYEERYGVKAPKIIYAHV